VNASGIALDRIKAARAATKMRIAISVYLHAKSAH
jgi:hypothetical protein